MLESAVRARIEADLGWYREARAEAALLSTLLSTLRGPTAARWSQTGAARGRRGDPTSARALACARISTRLGRAALVSAAIDAWLWAPERHPDDRLLLALLYGLHRPERLSLAEAASVLGIPCTDADELRAVEAHVDGLLCSVGVLLRHVRPVRGARQR